MDTTHVANTRDNIEALHRKHDKNGRAETNSETREHPYVKNVMPFCRFLRLFGFMYIPCDPNTSSYKCWRLYNYIIMTVMWFNTCRYFGAYQFGDEFNQELILKLAGHAGLFWGSTGASLGILLVTKHSDIFTKWRIYVNHYHMIYDKDLTSWQGWRTRITIIINGVVISAHSFSFIYMNIDQRLQKVATMWLLPFVLPCESHPSTLFYFVAVTIYTLNIATAAMCASQLSYMLLVILGVRDEIQLFNQDFKKRIMPSKPSLKTSPSESIEDWRFRHLELSRLVESMDDGFGLYILMLFVIHIPMSSLLIYAILDTMAMESQQDGLVPALIMLFSLLMSSIGILLGITYIGSSLYEEATACKSYLYSLELKGEQWTMERSLQYMTFYNKLTEGHIGITGWKLFYINKLTTKTVILMIVSYSVILLKFGQSGSDPPFHCPETPSNVTDMVATTTGY